MKRAITCCLLSVLLLACTSDESEAATRPEFINFSAIENNADDITASRKSEAYRATASVLSVGAEEIVVIARRRDQSEIAYVLQTQHNAIGADLVMNSAWVVYLQDHLLLFDESSGKSLHLSIGDRPLDSEVIAESYAFTDRVTGFGIARYANNTASPEKLRTAASYLAARE